MLSSTADRLAVWGDPIAHSRSPQLHAAAYAVLGRDWTYGRRRVGVSRFRARLNDLDERWRGLSLTMPLKGVAHAAASEHDLHARATGAVNTLLLDPDGPKGFNTDVGGLVDALHDEGVRGMSTARLIGGGATATSALVALAELGARVVEVALRRPEAAGALVGLGRHYDIDVRPIPLDGARTDVPVTIAALPGDARLDDEAARRLAGCGGLLLDVVYGTWPTPLAESWSRTGGHAVSGLGMLLHQAVRQVRVFTSGTADEPLDDEEAVLSAMRSALVGD